MQEVSDPVAARRPAQQQFVGVDLRRPKGYPAATAAESHQPAAVTAAEGDPCPRCESRDTKFCYYNNYNTAQPRHFCKGCRRYWTKGGTLRNVPVGGGTRKKASSSSATSSSSSPATTVSSYAAAAKPKRPYKKKRRVAPPEPAADSASAKAAAVTTTDAASEITTEIVAPAPADSAKAATTNMTTTTTTDAASEVTTELVVPAAVADDDSVAHLLQPDDDAVAVALGLGLSDLPSVGGGKGAALHELEDSFEWPAAFDLSATCWGGTTAGFGDPDPALFLNLP